MDLSSVDASAADCRDTGWEHWHPGLLVSLQSAFASGFDAAPAVLRVAVAVEQLRSAGDGGIQIG